MSEFILSAFADEIDPNLGIQMDVLDHYGIKYIEMRGVNGKNLVEYSLDQVKLIKKELDERGFKISAIGSPIGKIDITEDFNAHLALFKHTLDIAKILETNYIRLFSFFIPKVQDPYTYRDEVLYRSSQFIRLAENSNITLLHENEKGIYGDTPERCLDLINSLNCSYYKAIFDPANFVQCDVKTFPEAFSLLKDYIEYVHIKDAVFKDHHVTPSGEGDGKLFEILSTLHKSNFKGFLSIEPHLQAFAGFSKLERLPETEEVLTSDGAIQFSIAFNALRKILDDIREEKIDE